MNTYAPAADGNDSTAYINFVVSYMKSNWKSTVDKNTVLVFAGSTETNADSIKMFKELNKAILDQEGKLTATLISLIDNFDISKLK